MFLFSFTEFLLELFILLLLLLLLLLLSFSLLFSLSCTLNTTVFRTFSLLFSSLSLFSLKAFKFSSEFFFSIWTDSLPLLSSFIIFFTFISLILLLLSWRELSIKISSLISLISLPGNVFCLSIGELLTDKFNFLFLIFDVNEKFHFKRFFLSVLVFLLSLHSSHLSNGFKGKS